MYHKLLIQRSRIWKKPQIQTMRGSHVTPENQLKMTGMCCIALVMIETTHWKQERSKISSKRASHTVTPPYVNNERQARDHMKQEDKQRKNILYRIIYKNNDKPSHNYSLTQHT